MGSMLNKVVEISAVQPFALKVRFSDGATGLHDCTALVASAGTMVAPLRDPDFFARVTLEYGAPTWPNGYDMCPTGFAWKWKRPENRFRFFETDGRLAQLKLRGAWRFAYELARQRAHEAREAQEHWNAVRREIGRRTGRSFLDVATRMLRR